MNLPQNYNDDETSDDGAHELDKVILVQPVGEQDSAGEEEEGGAGTQEQKKDDNKKDDKVKVELTVPTVQTEEHDIETVRLDQEEATSTHGSQADTDSKKATEESEPGGDKEEETVSDETKQVKEEQPPVEVEDVPVQDPISIPSSKSEDETCTTGDVKMVGGEEKDKLSQTDKPEEQVPPGSSNTEVLSSQKEADESKPPPQHQQPDPTASSSHPLKPLPNIDDGITATKSEPRLPLLPPIGSKKMASLQSNNSSLKSHSATGLISNTAAKDPTKGTTERRKEGETAPLNDLATAKKKRSADTLRSTSGSSISKSKRSSGSSSSAVSLGSKSKSRESLKSGSQTHLSATTKSSDNLANGTTKKLSRSRESLKAASQVYSSVPVTKNGESLKKGDSGRNLSSSKSKEASKDKEKRSSEQKPPNQDDEALAEKAPDRDVKEKATQASSSLEEQPTKPDNSSAKRENTDEAATAVSTSEKQVSSSDHDAHSNNSKEDKSAKSGEEAKEDTGVSSHTIEEKEKEPSESDKVQGKAHTEEISPPPKPAASEGAEKKKGDNKPSLPNSEQERAEVKTDHTKSKEDEHTELQEESSISKIQPKELSVSPAAGDDTSSQTSSSDNAKKLEIDKKTGQSEQSIVEAVEKSTGPSMPAQDITTSA